MVSLLVVALILFAIAVALLVAELFLPSHGILTGMCVVAALGAVICAYMASPAIGVAAAILCIAAAPAVIYYAIRIYPQTAVGRRVILQTPQKTGFEETAAAYAALTGQEGIAITVLRPSGTCEFGDRRYDCVAESTIIPAGAKVKVERVVGMRIIVRQVA